MDDPRWLEVIHAHCPRRWYRCGYMWDTFAMFTCDFVAVCMYHCVRV